MNGALQQLASQVLLGTERRTVAPTAVDGAIGALLRQAGDSPKAEAWTTEGTVLRSAGVLALCGEVGFLPPTGDDPLPAVCPADSWPAVDEPTVIDILKNIIDDATEALCRESFIRLAANRRRLPPRLLPTALTLGKRLVRLRPLLLPVLGERGRWLAAANPAWRHVAGNVAGDVAGDVDPASPDDTPWHEGTLDQRRSWLTALRARDPAAARQRLQDGLSEMNAAERLALLDIFDNHLSPADEDFLEALLTDRSKEVRQRAAMLLSLLPQSRLVTRMSERMRALLHQERKLFRKQLVIEAPTAFVAEWKSDGLEEKRPKSETLGDRGWWLYQLAGALPLVWWIEQTGRTPAELIAWANAGDWREALLRAWGKRLQGPAAAQAINSADWAEALLSDPQAVKLLGSAPLLACLPVTRREDHWRQTLTNRAEHPLGGALEAIVRACTHAQVAPSANFSRFVLDEIKSA
ncbi:MAG TPA: DUF5691 domain-containing protein, partial [Accumulibacter sp.]|nr:DUF5691 domain-containing protein [Accumulibacter sp.]